LSISCHKRFPLPFSEINYGLDSDSSGDDDDDDDDDDYFSNDGDTFDADMTEDTPSAIDEQNRVLFSQSFDEI
jgi:hypothetical protein